MKLVGYYCRTRPFWREWWITCLSFLRWRLGDLAAAAAAAGVSVCLSVCLQSSSTVWYLQPDASSAGSFKSQCQTKSMLGIVGLHSNCWESW